MKITRTSPFTGTKRFMDIDVTGVQLHNWEQGELIQEAMPNLSTDEREFIMTGITSEEWETVLGGEDDD